MTARNKILADLTRTLKQERDELKLQIHLGKEEVQQEWESLQTKLSDLNERYDPLKDAVGETADDVWASLTLVGEEIRDGFQRIRKAL